MIMNNTKTCILSFLMALAMAGTAQEYEFYETRKGDTRGSIARQNGLSVNKLVAYNPNLEDTVLPFQVILIPQAGTPDQPQTVQHTVQEGQTLYWISRKYGVSLPDLKLYNPELGDRPEVGKTITIPQKTMQDIRREKFMGVTISDDLPPMKYEGESKIYKVKEGESLFRIGLKNGVGIDELRAANPELGNTPAAGTEVKIPTETKAQKMRNQMQEEDGGERKTIQKPRPKNDYPRAPETEEKPAEREKQQKPDDGGLEGW